MLLAGRGLRVCLPCRSKLVDHGRRTISTKYLQISEEVRQAINERHPVVALESTIFTHGYPFPENVSLAARLEKLVRSNGGVPATIGILDGIARVGLGAEELERLARSAGQSNTLKVSRRDLAYACGTSADGQRRNGGTTVAGTMVLAHLAGIKIFATGGLGGVHRGAESSMDISADLTELGRTPVAVISSGCKQFLDIPRTLEYLETQGVPVATFADGRADKIGFPAFWSRDSGHKADTVIRDEAEAAAVIQAQHAFGLQTGLLLANPIPAEHSIPSHEIDHAIDIALDQAAQAGVRGNASTPYILAKIRELTQSRSVTANTALVESNVIRGTRVAKELALLERQDLRSAHMPQVMASHAVMSGPAAGNFTARGLSKGLPDPVPTKTSSEAVFKSSPEDAQPGRVSDPLARSTADVFAAGSLAIDLACNYQSRSPGTSSSPALHTSNPASIVQTLGGVAHNVARAAQLAGANVQFCSAVGGDITGKAVFEALAEEGFDTSLVETFAHARTAQYIAVNDANKELVMAMSDMSLLDGRLNQGEVMTDVESVFEKSWRPALERIRPSVLAVDANWQPEMLSRWLKAAKAIGTTTVFEPVSDAKSTRVFDMPGASSLGVWPQPTIDVASPNAYELAAMHTAAKDRGFFERDDWWHIIDSLGIPSSGARKQLALATSNALVDQGIPQQCIQLLPFIPVILCKLGAQGVLLAQILVDGDPRLSSGDAAPYVLSRNINGPDDASYVGGLYLRLFPAIETVPQDEIVSVNGVGDTFIGTLVAGLASKGKAMPIENLVDTAQRAAVMTLKSALAVSPDISKLRALLGAA